MVQVLEILPRWLRGDAGVRIIAQGAGVDRKSVQRRIVVAQELGPTRSGDEEQLTDESIGRVRNSSPVTGWWTRCVFRSFRTRSRPSAPMRIAIA
jgi:hypothetical protein